MELLGNSGLWAFCPLQLLPRLGAVNSPPQGSLQQFLPWLPALHCGLWEKSFRPSVCASIKVSLGKSLTGCQVVGEGCCCHGKNVQNCRVKADPGERPGGGLHVLGLREGKVKCRASKAR